jgi:hypothetical protein
VGVVVYSHVIQVKHAVDDALIAAAEQIGAAAEGHAIEYCPVGDTGILSGSISHDKEVAEHSVTIAVGTNVEYGVYVELGHKQQPGRYVPAIGKRLKADFVAAKPFLRPAFENHIPEFEEILAAMLGGI